MARRRPSISARETARRLRGGPTFIQRSRDESSEQKAIWHNVTGAGRSQVRRPFFELGEEDGLAMKEAYERMANTRLRQDGAKE